jgi:hypothetical protein
MNRKEIFKGAAGAMVLATVENKVFAGEDSNHTSSHNPKKLTKEGNMNRNTGHLAMNTQNTALVLVDHQVGTIGWAGELVAEEREQLKMWTRVIARFAKDVACPSS